MTADVDIPALVATLAGIHQRAPWAHSLAYDRPGRNLDPDHTWTTGTGPNDRPPVGRWDDDGNITAIADTEAGRRWHELVRLLRGAHHDLHATLLRHRNPRVLDPTSNPLDRPRNHVTALHIQRACESLTRLLRPLMSADLPAALTSELANIASAVESADDLFPDAMFDPPQPPQGRNPHGNDRCLTVPRYGDGMGLCEACAKLWDDIAADNARQRHAAKDPACEEAGCQARRIARGKCMGHYQRARRARLLRQAEASL